MRIFSNCRTNLLSPHLNGISCFSIPFRYVDIPSHNLLGLTIQVLSNLVNYKSFGFTKIIPRVPQEKFEAAVKSTVNASTAVPLWDKVGLRFTSRFNKSSAPSSKITSTHLNPKPVFPSVKERTATFQTTISAKFRTMTRWKRSKKPRMKLE